MRDLFQNILIASVHGSVMIAVILFVRAIPVKIPRKYFCFLWMLTGLRLLMPFEIQSPFSLQPELPPVMLRTSRFREIAPWIWAALVSCFALYLLYTYFRTKWRVRDAMRIQGGWESDKIETAFVLGFLRPKIYIPMGMPDYVNENILAHERTHLDKGDHWFKMVGFLALALHWFNPLVWVAYCCLSKDIELACDERVIQFMDVEERRAYASSLLCCSSNHTHYGACPVAFGEVSIKGRVQAVMNYRRPRFIISFLGILATCFVAVCLFPMPSNQRSTLEWAQELNAEDIAYMEVISYMEDSADPYQRLEGEDMTPMVELIQASSGKYWDAGGNLPEAQEILRVTMTDGTIHTVSNSGNELLIIDGDAYKASTAWLDSWNLGGIRDPRQERPKSTSPYIRQRWAQDLKATDVARIDLTCNDEERPFASFTGEAVKPLVEMLNAIDGEFAAEPIVSGRTQDIYPSTLYVFMEDDTRYTVEKIAGAECNYIAVDGSCFVCDDELFNRFPETGTGPWPEGHIIEGSPPEEEIPQDQISWPKNIAPEAPQIPRPEGYTTYDWMVNLKAEDVDYIEFVDLYRIEAPYRRYDGAEIQEVIDLFQANQCYEYTPAAEWPGFFSSEFHIMMKDGTAHTVCSIYSTVTVIDGAAFGTFSDWLNNAWPDYGDEPLPENWGEMKASRNYIYPENEASVLSTSAYEAGKENLDHQYHTNVEMGCVERGYEIGRNVIRLSATDATSTGLTLNAYWPGSAVGAQLKVKQQYFLEQWWENPYDGTKGYDVMKAGSLILAPEQSLLSGDTAHWTIRWKDFYGSLEPGFYRIGMTIYEEIDGTVQNETIAYAKFSLPDSEAP